MLSIYRRHNEKCRKKLKIGNEDIQKCACPLMVMGMDRRGIYHDREALHTRDLFIAQEVLRKIESGEVVKPPAESSLLIPDVCESYVRIMTSQRGWKDGTVRYFKAVQNNLERFSKDQGVKYFPEITTEFMDRWIEKWDVGDSTKQARGGYLRGLFTMAVKRKWVTENPIEDIQFPKSDGEGKTAPFELTVELPKIENAIPRWMDGYRNQMSRKTAFTRIPETTSALVLLLRLTGLRVSDAFMFNPRALTKRVIEGEEMYCYYGRQKKTERPVFLPFYPNEVRPIIECEWMSEGHAFWDGKTRLADWNSEFHRVVMRMLERVSGVPNIHPHRFRDTFAVELLSKGADIRSVSRLLGHKSVNTTLQYYEHWVQEDQDKLVRAFMRKRTVPIRRAG
jgi:integrase/recombinase XerD